MTQYPTWRYSSTEPPKIIQSAAEEAEGWYDSPTKCVPAPGPEPVVPDPDVPDYVKRMRAKRIKYQGPHA